MLLSLTVTGRIAGVVGVEIDGERLTGRAEQVHLDLGSFLNPGEDWKVLEPVGSVVAVRGRIERWIGPRNGVVLSHLVVLAQVDTQTLVAEDSIEANGISSAAGDLYSVPSVEGNPVSGWF